MHFEFRFGQPATSISIENGTLVLKLQNQHVAGSGQEFWSLAPDGELIQTGDLTIWKAGGQCFGAAVVSVADHSVRARTESLYRQIGEICEGYNLHRYWNFIPRINAPVGELDRYMCFCAGRTDAFARMPVYGKADRLPPASAVGTPGDQLCVVFQSGTDALTNLENPAQVPAYRYPQRYGPAPPAFARAGLVPAQKLLYISGTASILASESQHVDDVVSQARLALENLGRVAAVAQQPGACSTNDLYRRWIRIYLREPEMWHELAPIFDQHLTAGAAQLNVVQADICRPELLVEVEMLAMSV
jgi:enamine deaminase RidA (YjgF/YER057c/UK114 family)